MQNLLPDPVGALSKAVTDALPSGLGESELAQEVRKKLLGDGKKSNSGFEQFLKSVSDTFGNVFNGLKSFVVGIVDPKSIPLEKNLYARLGFDEKGAKKTGTNPFSSIDTALGISVSGDIQDACKNGISSMAGWFGFSSDASAGYQNAINTHSEVYATVYNALKEKYGRSAADEEPLKQIAQQVASAVSGLDPVTLASEDAVGWTAKNPPTSGYAAMLHTAQTNKESGGAAPPLVLDTSGITQAQQQLAAFRNPASAPSSEVAQKALAAANQNIRDGKEANTVDSQSTAPRPGGAMRRTS